MPGFCRETFFDSRPSHGAAAGLQQAIRTQPATACCLQLIKIAGQGIVFQGWRLPAIERVGRLERGKREEQCQQLAASDILIASKVGEVARVRAPEPRLERK